MGERRSGTSESRDGRPRLLLASPFHATQRSCRRDQRAHQSPETDRPSPEAVRSRCGCALAPLAGETPAFLPAKFFCAGFRPGDTPIPTLFLAFLASHPTHGESVARGGRVFAPIAPSRGRGGGGRRRSRRGASCRAAKRARGWGARRTAAPSRTRVPPRRHRLNAGAWPPIGARVGVRALRRSSAAAVAPRARRLRRHQRHAPSPSPCPTPPHALPLPRHPAHHHYARLHYSCPGGRRGRSPW